VEVPDPPVILVEESVQTRLVELIVIERVTVPVNPFRGATVTVEVLLAPALTITLVGFDDTAKSGEEVWTETETIVEWERDPLVPVTVTL
jgi:hypothetical protein